MSFLSHIATAVPAHRYTQKSLADFMQRLYGLEGEEAKKLSLLYQRSGIESRYSVIPDIDGYSYSFFPSPEGKDPFPSLDERMDLFLKEACELGKAAALPCLDKMDKDKITHLITVSCTGMSAPGLEIQLMQSLGLSPNVQRSTVNFMGCYAAVHALKQADHICRSRPSSHVLIVCVELCSIHFQRDHDMDNVTANLLFADGAAAALVCGEDKTGEALEIKDFYSHLEIDGISDMAWRISSKGFLMTLSAYIPKLIKKGFKNLVDSALKELNLSASDVTHWAIHPGGRKILEGIYKEMEFTNGALESSYEVLRQYGNMSSPTILFVLKDLWDSKLTQKQATIFGAAFGPGLTMETFVLEKTGV